MARRGEEFAFTDGINRITGVLNRAAQELDDLAESLEGSGSTAEELKAGKTAEEITAPMDSISAILGRATAEVRGMTAELFDDCKEAKA
jgi:ABC-type transporter Mla subunit MlaD